MALSVAAIEANNNLIAAQDAFYDALDSLKHDIELHVVNSTTHDSDDETEGCYVIDCSFQDLPEFVVHLDAKPDWDKSLSSLTTAYPHGTFTLHVETY